MSQLFDRPRWCCVKFLDEGVVHVNDDKTKNGHWTTACGRDIMDVQYSRAHPQMVSCLECLVIMGPDNLYWF